MAPSPRAARDRRPDARLDRDRIVAAAIAIADREGVDQLSMRRVATALGAGAMSLYRHVRDKDELIEHMVEAVLGDWRTGQRPSGDWRANLRAMARQQRKVLRAHPWFAAQMASRPTLGPNAVAAMDVAIGAARGAGVDLDTAALFLHVVMSFVLGAVLGEVAEIEERRKTGMTEAQWRASRAGHVRALIASGAYPHFSARVIDGTDLSDDERFERGLDCVLDGLATRVEAPRRQGRVAPGRSRRRLPRPGP